MIAQLKGRVFQSTEDTLLVDVNDVGYEITCSSTSQQDLLAQDSTRVFIHTHVREDAFILFGFSTLLEKRLFLSLIKVNGIGPKMAISILSASTIENIIQFIEDGNVKGLSSLPKIGKKKAEQIVLSLKGKLVMDEDQKSSTSFPARDDICSALINLGFKANDVTKVVESLPCSIDVQTGVRQGLSALTQTLS